MIAKCECCVFFEIWTQSLLEHFRKMLFILDVRFIVFENEIEVLWWFLTGFNRRRLYSHLILLNLFKLAYVFAFWCRHKKFNRLSGREFFILWRSRINTLRWLNLCQQIQLINKLIFFNHKYILVIILWNWLRKTLRRIVYASKKWIHIW